MHWRSKNTYELRQKSGLNLSLVSRKQFVLTLNFEKHKILHGVEREILMLYRPLKFKNPKKYFFIQPNFLIHD